MVSIAMDIGLNVWSVVRKSHKYKGAHLERSWNKNKDKELAKESSQGWDHDEK